MNDVENGVEHDLERVLRDTFAAAGQHAPDVRELAAHARRRARAQRRRQATLLGTAAVLLAAVAGTVALSGIRSPGQTQAAGPAAVALPTSSWEPGDGQRQALLTGTVRVTGGGCVYVDASVNPAVEHRVDVLWPRGYTARRPAAGGGVEILAPDGTVVAREGQRIAAGGGYNATKALGEQACSIGSDGAFIVEDDLTRRQSAR